MPVSFRFEPGTGVAIMTGSGVLRVGDALEAVQASWNSPYGTHTAVLWDFHAAQFDLSTSQIREVADFILQNQPVPPPRKVAFVTKRELDFGLARMFEVFRESSVTEFRVYRDYEEALRWARSRDPG